MGRGDRFSVVFDDDGFFGEAELLEELGEGETIGDLAGFVVDEEGHELARMAGSQSFQTGSNPWVWRRRVISVTGRLSSISN